MTVPVECWQPIVGASERQLDFMAKHRMKGMIEEPVTERLMELQDKFSGLDQVNLGCTAMSITQDVTFEQLELFALELFVNEVMPRFKNQAAWAKTAGQRSSDEDP